MRIWSPSRIDVGQDYEQFFEINKVFMKLFSTDENKLISYWEIEHAFWYHNQLNDPTTTESKDKPKTEPKPIIHSPPVASIPESYIPPVVSILPQLAENTEEIQNLYKESARTVATEFENRLAILFTMLGYEVENLGQGHGPVPDGIARNLEYGYSIIYDAKVRQSGYSTNTSDERAVRDYILSHTERLKKSGSRNIYFAIISSTFIDNHEDFITNLKITTDIKAVILMEVGALLEVLEKKLRDTSFHLGLGGFQNFLASGGIITTSDMKELLS